MRNACLKISILLLILTLCISAKAQYVGSGTGVYAFMDLPTSARLNALGGTNMSIRNRDISMAMRNPALLDPGEHGLLELNFCYLMEGTGFGSVLYGQTLGRNHIAGGVQYVDYGTMQYADEWGNTEGYGKFGARDIVMSLMYGRALAEGLTIGVALKPVISSYERYTSFALGADVGLHYQTRDTTWQVGVSLQNIGWQLVGYYSDGGIAHREMLPLNLQVGFNYWFRHAPIRLGMTIHNLQSPVLGYSYTNPYTPDLKEHPERTDIHPADMVFRHAIFFLDVMPRHQKWHVTLSYNHRRRGEMNLTDQFSLAGFSLGAGIRMGGVHADVAYSQLAKNNMNLQVSVGLDIRYLQDQTIVRKENKKKQKALEETLTEEEKAQIEAEKARQKEEEKQRKAEERQRRREESLRRQEEFTRKLQGL